MEYCIYRQSVELDKEEDGNSPSVPGLQSVEGPIGKFGVAGVGYNQEFCNGLCSILTVNDIGMMECRRPNNNDRNCPDIAHLQKQS